MKDLTKYYIDLSKCTEEEKKHIFSLLPEPKYSNQYTIDFGSTYKLSFFDGIWWVFNRTYNRTELTYPEFIKLFDGEEDNNGWIEMEKTQPEIGSLIVHARERDNGNIDYEIEIVTEEFLRWADWNGFKFWKYFTPEPPKF